MTPLSRQKQAKITLFLNDGICGESTDNELLAAIALDDRQAFAILMQRYLSPIVALAYRVLFDVEQAREVAQEAFLRVWHHAGKWDPRGKATFGTWLRCVTVNLAISQRRRRRVQVGLEAIEDLPDAGADGFNQVASTDRQRLVQAALHKLPDRQRAAIALYYFENITQIQAAEAMQMTPRAFDSLIVRARGGLKRHLAALGLSRGELLA